MGIKDRRTKILLSLILLSDVNLGGVAFNDKLQRIFDLKLNQKTKGTISGLIKEGSIEKTHNQEQTQDGGVIQTNETNNQYRLTEKGFYHICLKFPFFRFVKDTWDSKWRILSYEIPEKKREIRDRLRREVAGWGLGPWHRSFWLTPHPIIENLRELIYQQEEEKYVQAFESDHVVGQRDVLIEKVWQKSTLEKKYRDIFKVWHDILSQNGEKLDKFSKIISLYVEILKNDPGLPPELMGSNWIGFEAFKIYKEIRSILLA
ncbi:hypothetical protein A2774_04785 [Candidatus Roizmanbacteria bacterium RIFCSPHIGHO2_01_FULL_39_12c]|uniref:Uncharacterized protein n=1 Tax=Candidatus Roizmanbacteria bacterium RIFCSPHIGHO2_01_FULL_39_12c TaxID=1802031 RepID=A0A1F7GFE7_9BACT|nr:MAG: hypothetical protein A2774_04785 [Candidatus Roizmanbacteria bacterium RIFCSPHIGHO2_01_FULL_39_12c]OGK46245.1 MAG: hypothetical protein A2963_02140 [Candidatus Roizmanbacteria bacterium RIFCSPLOWO2_01_FULL_40_13]